MPGSATSARWRRLSRRDADGGSEARTATLRAADADHDWYRDVAQSLDCYRPVWLPRITSGISAKRNKATCPASAHPHRPGDRRDDEPGCGFDGGAGDAHAMLNIHPALQ